MGSPLAKQFMLVAGKPVLMHTLQRFHEAGKDIHLVLVLPATEFVYWKGLCKQHKFTLSHQLVAGGDSRFQSVKNGLEAIPADALVAVHDGVRPCVNRNFIDHCFAAAAENGNAIPCITVHETLRKVEEESSQQVDRNEYRLVQTPQCFHASVLKEAYARAESEDFTDDAGVVEASGVGIFLVPGLRENIKITTPVDLQLAEGILKHAVS